MRNRGIAFQGGKRRFYVIGVFNSFSGFCNVEEGNGLGTSLVVSSEGRRRKGLDS